MTEKKKPKLHDFKPDPRNARPIIQGKPLFGNRTEGYLGKKKSTPRSRAHLNHNRQTRTKPIE